MRGQLWQECEVGGCNGEPVCVDCIEPLRPIAPWQPSYVDLGGGRREWAIAYAVVSAVPGPEE